MGQKDKPSFWSRIVKESHVQPSSQPAADQSQATAPLSSAAAMSAGDSRHQYQGRKWRFSRFSRRNQRQSDKHRSHYCRSAANHFAQDSAGGMGEHEPTTYTLQEAQKGSAVASEMHGRPATDSTQLKIRSKQDAGAEEAKSDTGQSDPWIEAYEKLRNEEKDGNLVDAYEKILTHRATTCETGTHDIVQADGLNRFEGLTKANRVDMMKTTLSPVLERAREEKTWKNITMYSNALIEKISKGIGDALQTHPPAAMAWSGICLLLPIIVKPIKEEEKMAEGLEYIMNRMDWYIPLTKVVLQREWPDNLALQQHQSSLKDEVVTLFKYLLKFEMECACRAYSKHPVVRVLGDIVSMSGWEEKLEAITKLEGAIEKDLRNYGLNTLAEYSSQTASYTKHILEEVKQFNEVATRTEEARAAKRRDDLVGLLPRFGNTTYLEQMEFNPRRHPGTCEWFCRHQKYTSWLNSTRNELLLVTAEPGCGKSVLARFLIETELPSRRKDAVIGYFFFKDNPVQNNLLNALSAILHQLLTLCPDILNALRTDIKKLSPELLKDCSQLWRLIEDTSENLNLQKRSVFCVFDAFDECNSDGRERLISLLSSHLLSKKRIRFLVTSRGYPVIVSSFQPIAENFMRLEGEGKSEKDQLQDEIDVVFRHRVQNLVKNRKLSQNVSNMLDERLHMKGKGQRTYLWVRLVFKFLDGNYPLNLGGWSDLLDQLPEDVPGVYEKLLSNVSGTNRTHVETLLRLVYVAEEPLSLTAANIAVNLRGKYSLESLDGLGLSDDESFKEWVINTCGFFITDYDGKLFFIHQTAKEFLSMVKQNSMDEMSSVNGKDFSVQTTATKSNELAPRNNVKWKGSITSEIEAHLVMAQCCLANLAIYTRRPETRKLEAVIEDAWEYDKAVYDEGIKEFIRQMSISDGLVNYSSKYWPKHFRAAGLHLPDISAGEMKTGDAHRITNQSLYEAYKLVMTYPTRSVWLLSPTRMVEIEHLVKRYGRLLTEVGSLYVAEFGKGSLLLEAWPRTTLLSLRCSPIIFACLLGFPLLMREWLSDNAETHATQGSGQKCCTHSSEVERKLALVCAIFSTGGVSQGKEKCISEILSYEEKLAQGDLARLERLLWFMNKVVDAIPGYLDESGMKLLARDQLKEFEARIRSEDRHKRETAMRNPRRAETA